jgi:hypothetical protein
LLVPILCIGGGKLRLASGSQKGGDPKNEKKWKKG